MTRAEKINQLRRALQGEFGEETAAATRRGMRAGRAYAQGKPGSHLTAQGAPGYAQGIRFERLKQRGVSKRSDQDTRRQRQGAAMAASGSVLGGTGLIAGGVPGAKEPNSLKIWNLKGNPDARSRLSRSNLLHNGKIVAPQPRAGILGFRANMHDAFIEDEKNKTGGGPYREGMRAGKLEAERKIVPGMRLARRAAHPITIGGGLLALEGLHRMDSSRKVGKANDRRQNASAAMLGGGATAAAVGDLAPRGLDRYTRHYGRQAIEHTRAAQQIAPHFGGMRTTAPKKGPFGQELRPGKTTIYPLRDDKELARDGSADRIKGGDEAKAAAGRLRGMATQERHFAEAFDGTGRVIRRVRNPALALAAAGGTGLWASRGGKKKVRKGSVTAIRPGVSTKPVGPVWQAVGVGRPFTKPMAVAGAGLAGMVELQREHIKQLSRQRNKLASQNGVGKNVQYGYQETKHSLVRTGELLAGTALVGYGATRLNMVGSLARYGARIAEKQGAKPEQVERVLSAARAVGHGVREVTGDGEAQLRRVKALDLAISAIPSGLRPAVATTAGVMLVQHAHPTARETFTPMGRY